MTAPVLVSKVGAIFRIELNREKALNSLTMEMVRLMREALDTARADEEVAAVLVSGRGEKGLCAGGDVRQVHESTLQNDGAGEAFFREEYALNLAIAEFPKPYIAIMDGITMGGGVGVSAHGSLRVVTERSKIAMPETKIGLIPDVGASYLLARAPGFCGLYLGLTGQVIGAADAIYAGLADLMVNAGDLPALYEALGKARADEIERVLRGFAQTPPPGMLADAQSEIDALFGQADVVVILRAAEQADTALGAAVAKDLRARSPSALMHSFALLQAARRGDDLKTCLGREYDYATRLIHQHDFHEGIRAVLIDKDQAPRWRPQALTELHAV